MCRPNSKYCTWLKRHFGVKRSSLFRCTVDDEEKSVLNDRRQGQEDYHRLLDLRHLLLLAMVGFPIKNMYSVWSPPFWEMAWLAKLDGGKKEGARLFHLHDISSK
jgi:hypothetical protein